ncbi:hypothetical protein JCM11641_000573, partial [Rhodosporidiobolus odoratus]
MAQSSTVPSASYFANYRSQKGLSKDQARPLMFANDGPGQAAYAKALAAFKKTYAADPGNTPITAAFPCKPGSLPPATRSCDKCGTATDHIATNCNNTPVDNDERNYRRAWRWVAMKRTAPTWGSTPGYQVNLVPNMDEHMGRGGGKSVRVEGDGLPSTRSTSPSKVEAATTEEGVGGGKTNEHNELDIPVDLAAAIRVVKAGSRPGELKPSVGAEALFPLLPFFRSFHQWNEGQCEIQGTSATMVVSEAENLFRQSASRQTLQAAPFDATIFPPPEVIRPFGFAPPQRTQPQPPLSEDEDAPPEPDPPSGSERPHQQKYQPPVIGPTVESDQQSTSQEGGATGEVARGAGGTSEDIVAGRNKEAAPAGPNPQPAPQDAQATPPTPPATPPTSRREEPPLVFPERSWLGPNRFASLLDIEGERDTSDTSPPQQHSSRAQQGTEDAPPKPIPQQKRRKKAAVFHPGPPEPVLLDTIRAARKGFNFKHKALIKGPEVAVAEAVAIVDDGAECNLVDATWFESWRDDLGLEVETDPNDFGIRTATNAVKRGAGSTTFRIQLNDLEVEVKAKIIDSGGAFQ